MWMESTDCHQMSFISLKICHYKTFNCVNPWSTYYWLFKCDPTDERRVCSINFYSSKRKIYPPKPTIITTLTLFSTLNAGTLYIHLHIPRNRKTFKTSQISEMTTYYNWFIKQLIKNIRTHDCCSVLKCCKHISSFPLEL